MMRRSKAKELDLKVEAIFRDSVSVGVDPHTIGVGPSVAIPKLLKRNNLTLDDIDVFEISEEHASMVLYTIDALKIPEDKVNPWGGDIALGHPIGASAGIIVAKLIDILKVNKLKRGIVTLCVGMGMGVAALIELDE